MLVCTYITTYIVYLNPCFTRTAQDISVIEKMRGADQCGKVDRLECHSTNSKVTSSIPIHGTYLGYLHPAGGMHQLMFFSHLGVSLSFSLCLPLSKKIDKIFEKMRGICLFSIFSKLSNITYPFNMVKLTFCSQCLKKKTLIGGEQNHDTTSSEPQGKLWTFKQQKFYYRALEFGEALEYWCDKSKLNNQLLNTVSIWPPPLSTMRYSTVYKVLSCWSKEYFSILCSYSLSLRNLQLFLEFGKLGGSLYRFCTLQNSINFWFWWSKLTLSSF